MWGPASAKFANTLNSHFPPLFPFLSACKLVNSWLSSSLKKYPAKFSYLQMLQMHFPISSSSSKGSVDIWYYSLMPTNFPNISLYIASFYIFQTHNINCLAAYCPITKLVLCILGLVLLHLSSGTNLCAS